jgi:hypothetical protein
MSPTRKWTSVGFALVLAGVAVRLRTVELNPSLWLDESSLALNILSRSFAGLLKPLDYSQGAPIFFLWLEKLCVVITHSSSEFALRLGPLLSGCAACAVFWALCRRLRLTDIGTVCATALFCFSPGLIDYSGQAKQYSTDVSMAVAVYLVAVRFLQKPSWLNSVIYCLCGLLAIGMSHPAVFVLAGTGITALIDGWRRRDRRSLALQSGIICVWLIGFGVDFFFLLRHLSHIPGMVDYWQRTYWPFMPLSLRTPAWLFHAGVDAASMTGFKPLFLLPLAVLGVILLWLRDWRIPAMLYLPVCLAMLASAAERYPFADRMTLFIAPALLISAGASFSGAFLFRLRLLRPVALAVFCALMFAPATRVVALAIHPERFGREEFRDTFLDVVRSGRCADHVLIYERAANHYRYYERFRWSDEHPAPIVTASQLEGDASSIDSTPCFWLVFAHTPDSEVSSLSKSLLTRGYKEVSDIRRAGASAHLFMGQPAALGQ